MPVITCLADVKSGYTDTTTVYQHALYSKCRRADTHQPLPEIDKALILKCNDKACTPEWIEKDRLNEAGGLAIGLLNLWKDLVAGGLLENKDVYRLNIDGQLMLFPRVTSILKTLNREKLNSWRVRRAVEYTLEELDRTKKSPAQLLEAMKAGLFDPSTGAVAHMERRGGEGSALHKCVHSYLIGELVSIDPANLWLTSAYGHFLKWAQKVKLTLVDGLAETKVYNAELSYAGTLDFIATVEVA